MLSIVAVVLLKMLLRLLSWPDQIADVCGAQNRDVPACTLFVGNALGTECRKINDEWTIKAVAHITALVYITDHKYTLHELQHIGDMKAAVARLISDLEKARYGDAGACEANALDAANTFHDRMSSFAAASTARRH